MKRMIGIFIAVFISVSAVVGTAIYMISKAAFKNCSESAV